MHPPTHLTGRAAPRAHSPKYYNLVLYPSPAERVPQQGRICGKFRYEKPKEKKILLHRWCLLGFEKGK